LHRLHGLAQVLAEQVHDRLDLLARALPVLRREGVDRQILNAYVLAVGGDSAESLRPRGVARRPGKAALFCPPAVAVQYDGNVAGEPDILRLLRLLSPEYGHVLISRTALFPSSRRSC